MNRRNAHGGVLSTNQAVIDVPAGILDIATMALPTRATREKADPTREVI